MLLNQMPEIPYSWETGLLARFEALAFTALASYCDQAIQPRVLLSFQRAFDVNSLWMVNRVSNGHPGYCIGNFQTKPMQKVIVAVEGTTAWSQVVDLYNLNVRASVGSLQGYVYKKFADHAAAIYTELLGNTNFNWALGTLGAPIIFTGFSLGAAVAEVLAAMFRAAYPRKAFKVIKFASPRVGTVRWVAGRVGAVARDAVYFGRDPIDLFPYTLPEGAGLSTLNPLYNYTAWATSPEGTRLSINPAETPLPVNHQGGYQQAGQAARSLRQTMDRANQWSDHDKWYYYLGFLRNYVNTGNKNFEARARYLEFNDRNQFGQAYQGDTGITIAMETLEAPEPDPVEIDFSNEELNAMNDALVNAGADAVDCVFRDTPEGGTGGGGDDDPIRQERVIPNVAQIVAPSPAAFTWGASGRRRR